MSDNNTTLGEIYNDALPLAEDNTKLVSGEYKPLGDAKSEPKYKLTRMYRDWFIEYASYVILDRAVPHIDDGLKPVQRRILHAMKRLDDGRYNKVANIVGHTMQFHPHGDASIGDALVTMGQKDLLIDCQGNWGNIHTGDDAAATRYIEARLSKFALDVLFNPKTTDWKASYDGRNKEPITLPAKFPLLLAMGTKSVAVTLSSEILPHNLGEICEAAIAYLEGREFVLYPDFLTGSAIDVSRYNDGMRGGRLKARATIEKVDNKTLSVTSLPYGETTKSIIESINKATEKGKIKVKKTEDISSATGEVLVHLAPGTSSDKAIDALYAFTNCEVTISPICCVIIDNKPAFVTVSDVLRHSVNRTRDLLRRELEIRRSELLESLLFSSLERIFIEERIYKDKGFENAVDMAAALAHIDGRLQPFYTQLPRTVTEDDLLRLMEIKMARILKFNKAKADELIAKLKAEIESIDRDLGNMTEVTINWYRMLWSKYGAEHPRRTVIRTFDTIVAAKVVEANQKLYINRSEGFMGTSLKKDEFVENCSDIDDVIIFYRDGTYKVVRMGEKVFIGETERSKSEKKKAEIIHIAVFKKNDTRTIYNAVYRDGKAGNYYIKRFYVTSVTYDREYDITKGVSGSKVHYFTANPNGEAELIKVTLKPNSKVKKVLFDYNFSDLLIKGRQSQGNLLTKHEVHRISLKAQGGSTLGGRKVWFDHDVKRLNYDERGEYLGDFNSDDEVLVVLPSGEFYTTNFDVNNHYEQEIQYIGKFVPEEVWTVVLIDASQGGYPYVKRFCFERGSKRQNCLGDHPESYALIYTKQAYPRLYVTLGGADHFRAPFEVDVEQFIGVKSFKAKGKRITKYEVDKIEELEPLRFPEPKYEPIVETHLQVESDEDEALVRDRLEGQTRLFDTFD